MPELAFLANFSSATIAIFLTFITCAGWGYVTARLCRLKILYISLEQIWIGFAVVLAIVGVLHFFIAINWITSSTLLAAGIFFFIHQLRQSLLKPKLWFEQQKNQRVDLSYQHIFLSFILFGLWSIKAMETPSHYDSGLYYFNSIKWINEHSLVAGIGNLHSRLAFNQTWFGFAALINFDPFYNRGYALVGLFLLSLSMLHIFSCRKNIIFSIIVLPIFLFAVLLNLKQISSPSPDLPVALIQIVITILLLQITTQDTTKSCKEIQLITITALCVSLVTIKLSGAVFALTALMIALLTLRSSINSKMILTAIGLVTALYLPHLVRGYLLSGAPLFPSTIGAYTKFDWSMSFNDIRNIANWIYCWARSPDPECMQALKSWEWIGGWWQRFPNRNLLLFLLSGILFITPLIFKRFFSVKKSSITIFLLCIPALLSLSFWFFTAPEPRFLGSIAYILFGLAVLFCANAFKASKNFKKRNFCYEFPIFFALVLVVSYRSLSIEALKPILTNGFQPIQKVELTERKSFSGLSVYTPVVGDQCFDSPLPCTPYLNENLTYKINERGYPTKIFMINSK
jgi:hypothetical protein